jgi:hypothetical protein
MIRPTGEDGTLTTRGQGTQLNHCAAGDGWIQQAHQKAYAIRRQSRSAGAGFMDPGQLGTPSSQEDRRDQQ